MRGRFQGTKPFAVYFKRRRGILMDLDAHAFKSLFRTNTIFGGKHVGKRRTPFRQRPKNDRTMREGLIAGKRKLGRQPVADFLDRHAFWWVHFLSEIPLLASSIIWLKSSGSGLSNSIILPVFG